MTVESFKHRLINFYETQIEQADNIKIFDLNKITSGWETEVYSFDIEYQYKKDNIQENLILRTFPGKGGQWKSQYEFDLMKNLIKANYPVPRVYFLESEKKILGYPFIIMERMKGGTLSKVIREASDVEKQKLKFLYIEYFVKLHNLDYQKVAPNAAQIKFNNQFEYIENPLQSMRKDATRYKVEEFLEVVEWLEERVETVPNEQLSLVHYDYHPSNIVLSEEKKLYVIDWSVSRVTDFRVDLGWTLLLHSTYGAYENRDFILNIYQKICNQRIKQIEYFEVVAAARRLIVMAISLSGQDEVVGTRPEVAQILKGYTKHVDGVIRILKDSTGIILHGLESMIKKVSPR
ncbi:MAG: phosphotransferase [Candidatus Heimdallarchaeota archaeon]|nr:MAG: phosphotransferase [Candidatus Heimdallarchaeota archaeon]